jgi:hypothetical protein
MRKKRKRNELEGGKEDGKTVASEEKTESEEKPQSRV